MRDKATKYFCRRKITTRRVQDPNFSFNFQMCEPQSRHLSELEMINKNQTIYEHIHVACKML